MIRCASLCVWVVALGACDSGSSTETTADAASPSPDAAAMVDATPPPDAALGDAAAPAPERWLEACPVDTHESRRVQLSSVSLNVTCRGAGPTVVLLHGFPEFSLSWTEVMEALSGEYRLIAPDQRGYNTSEKPEDVAEYALPILIDDILELIDHVSDEPVLVVGHDWGGPVAWGVAHHPDANIRGLLITNGPHPIRISHLLATDEDQQMASSYFTLFRSDGAEAVITPEAIEGFFDGAIREDLLPAYREAWGQPGAITGGLNWYRANDFDVETVADISPALSPEIPVPVAVLWGLADTALLPQNAEGLEAFAPDLTVRTLPDVDHWIEHRAPEEVAAELRALDARASTGE